MCVELDRNAVGIVENDRHQRLHSFRRQQSSGIFQAEAVGLQRCRLARSLGEIFIAVFRRDGINQIQNDFHPDRMGDAHSELPAFIIVPFVRNARFANAVGKHPLDEQPIHRRRIVLERVNSARDYTQWRLGDFFGDEPHALPRIFFEFPNCLLQVRAGN